MGLKGQDNVESKKIFLRGFLSGLYLSLVVSMYLIVLNTIDNSKVISSFLFSFALLLIVGKGYYLYTGKVGYLLPYKKGNFKMVLITILSNILGIIITGLLLGFANISELSNYASNLVYSKFELKMWYESFILAMFCGVLMYTAVDGYDKINNNVIKVLVVILSVMTFLLAGFEHSVANIVYIVLAKEFSFKILGYLILMIIGNGIGAITINIIHSKIDQ